MQRSWRSHYFLGIWVRRNRESGNLTLDQKLYITSPLEKFQVYLYPIEIPVLQHAHLVKAEAADEIFPYREMVGCLIYAMVGTRPDIAYAVGLLSRFMHHYDEQHWMAATKVLS